MSEEHFHELVLYLDDIQYLFTEPEPDSDMYVSGIDYLYSEIKIYTRHDRFAVTIALPQEKMREDLGERTREKIKRYCHFKIRENEKDLLAQRHERSNALKVGLFVLVVGLVLAGIFTFIGQSGINTILAAICVIIGQGFVIAGWVAMWQPAELLLYDWWPYRRDIRIYEQIADANIVIKAGEPASAGK